MASLKTKQISVVTMSTLSFTACFAVWVMFSVIGIPIKNQLGLSQTEFGILAAMPILSGSLVRLPIGMLTDRFGGRPVFFWLMVLVIPPVYLIGLATEYWQFLLLGLYMGIAGGSFTVGIAYTARWFERRNQGFAMGIFGAGNAGAALTKFVAPSVVVAWGWQAVPQVYAVMMTVMAVLFWLFSYTDSTHEVKAEGTIRRQLAMLKDPTIWKYCQYYSLVFGGYVGVSLWMTRYYMGEYGHTIQTAALLASIFVLPSGVIRAIGGWLSDRLGAHTVTWWVMWTSLVCLFFMSYPQTDLVIHRVDGSEVRMHVGVNEWVFTFLLFVVGIAWGIGKASVFKYISDEYGKDIGVASGIVGLVGGLGGFLLPIMFGALLDVTGVNSTAFMLLFGITLVSIMWMQYSGERVRDREARALNAGNSKNSTDTIQEGVMP
ncbi:MAG: nitrate/nitrite transporter [Thiohalomonadaceae bacterium]